MRYFRSIDPPRGNVVRVGHDGAVQLRMARAAVGWGVRGLAEKAGVTANTVARIENGADAKKSTWTLYSGHSRRLASSSQMANSQACASPKP
jgi:hypothetical protein